MRIRRLLLVATLAVGAVALVPSAAFAASGEDPGSKFEDHLEHCLEAALDDKAKDESFNLNRAVEDCHAAPSIVVPAVAEMFWGALAWAIVAFFLLKFGMPAIKKTLKARQDKIRGDLEGAEHARTEAEAELVQYRAQLADSRSEGAAIVEAARTDAERVRSEILARAEVEATELKQRAAEDIDLATQRARTDLQGQVKELTIALAEKVVERNLDADTQSALIDSYISSVGSN
jgi:F-type H+-transporting ATPase subunit b